MDNMEDTAEKFPEIEDVEIKKESESWSVVVLDEVHVKEEVKEEPFEDVESKSSNYNEFDDYIKYKLADTSQSVYCDVCWTKCKDAEGLKHHQETSTGCKESNNDSASIVEDILDESCKARLLQGSDETTNVERRTEAIPGGSRSDPIESLEKTSNTKPSSVEDRNICNKNITEESQLNTHNLKRTGNRPHVCDVCNQAFIHKAVLNRHKLTHTGVRSFACDLCNQAFTQKNNLNRHKRKHTGERPFTCDVCNQNFTEKGNLNKHKLIHTGERSFTCDLCNKSFTRKGDVIRHKLQHTGVRPFACDVCNKTFTEKGNLNTHKLIHTGERSFSCDVCKKSFARKGDVIKHMLIHTGERLFSCNVCNKAFTEKGNLNKHKLIHAR